MIDRDDSAFRHRDIVEELARGMDAGVGPGLGRFLAERSHPQADELLARTHGSDRREGRENQGAPHAGRETGAALAVGLLFALDPKDQVGAA